MFDRRELDGGTDPADPRIRRRSRTTTTSGSNTTTTTLVPSSRLIRTSSLDAQGRRDEPDESERAAAELPLEHQARAGGERRRRAGARVRGDPTFGGADTRGLQLLRRARRTTSQATLPAAGWAVIGAANAPKGYRFVSADRPASSA